MARKIFVGTNLVIVDRDLFELKVIVAFVKAICSKDCKQPSCSWHQTFAASVQVL